MARALLKRQVAADLLTVKLRNGRKIEMITNERGDVRNWVKKAIDFLRSGGKEITLAEIANPGGQFVQNQRYVFALDLNGVMLAHPITERLVGRKLINLRDSEGDSFIHKIVNTAKTRGSGWVEYRWYPPESKEALRKTAYFERVDGMVLCSGYYTLEEDSPKDLFEYFRAYGPC
jgi:cytochrome c